MIIRSYRIADTIFSVDSIHNEVHDLCRDYQCNEPAEFTITINQQDIEYERERSIKTNIKEGNPVKNYSDSYLETLAVYRKLCEILIDRDILLFHGSVIAVDGIAFLFTAKSGTGKSTHTRLWREYFGERAVMINDDKPLLKITDSGVTVYGTPYDGKHRISTNTSAPLKAICWLNRGETNSIKEISKSEAYPILMQQTHRPVGASKMEKIFELLDKMCTSIKLYKLYCNITPDAVATAFNEMNKENL